MNTSTMQERVQQNRAKMESCVASECSSVSISPQHFGSLSISNVSTNSSVDSPAHSSSASSSSQSSSPTHHYSGRDHNYHYHLIIDSMSASHNNTNAHHVSLTDDVWSLSSLSPAHSEQNISDGSNLESSRSDHWSKTACDNLKSRISALFLNEFMSDVSFVCSRSLPNGGVEEVSHIPTQIPAHKFILATASTVFYAMFFGTLAEESKQILISDIDADTFTEMLRYLYCDRIDVDVDDYERLLGLLYASKKYFLHHLCEQCIERLRGALCAENACLILEQALLYGECDLADQSLEFIDAQTELALMSDNILSVSLQTINIILARCTLTARESIIYDGLERWCTEQCRSRSIEDVSGEEVKNGSLLQGKYSSALCPLGSLPCQTSSSCAISQTEMDSPVRGHRRQVAGDSLSLIRFTLMHLDEFANSAAQSDLLTSDAKNPPKLSYPTERRIGLKKRKCSRFKSSAFRTNQWRYRGRCDSIRFTVSRRIFLTGIGLFGSSNGAHEYKVTLEIKSQNSTVYEEKTSFQSDGTSSVFSVPINGPPITIQANTVYTICVTMLGTELSYFGQDGVEHVRVEPDIHFQFFSSPESTNGTGVQGGQIAELQFFCPSANSHSKLIDSKH